ncbi:1-deoxy-D-xylulose-5-phosphate synthase [bacterium]|jgi:1-deoxy-D-xylulose-5-phosphate synthase|nr:1-deoxy-D-xylulose-5-phosphate synthase [bacterium]
MALLLPTIETPDRLRGLSMEQLAQLAQEIRDELCQPLFDRTVHFASNLGVVELCISLHREFDFSRDRLIWDTGHQIYPHKLITGRYQAFRHIRTKGGIMGYPNPIESPYDLFMTGHAGSSLSTALGLKAGDDLQHEPDRHSVAVIGDGAFPSGIVFEAMNNAAGLNKNLLVILNDNKMSICPRVGGLSQVLDQARMAPVLKDMKRNLDRMVKRLSKSSGSFDRAWAAIKDVVKVGFFGGMLFEKLGFNYIGPIDGHDLPTLCEYLGKLKLAQKPTLLHVMTNKGHGVPSACEDPVKFHTPPVFESVKNGVVSLRAASSSRAFTDVVSSSLHDAMKRDPRVCVITAAMCQGNKLERIRADFPDRFFDVGICESHAVAFAAGLAKTGLRPVVDIYSTFLQRSFDQVFQEVALQNLPVLFCMDRAGFTGPDGPTHHGSFDIPYMRIFPNMTLLAPGDEYDVAPMIEWSLQHSGPVALRYPKAHPQPIERTVAPMVLGQAEVIEWGVDGCIVAYGSLLSEAIKARKELQQQGLDVGVINARFAKPIDHTTLLRAIEQLPFVLTVEEGVHAGGFGSALLEAANLAKINTSHLHIAAMPDRWVMHADRSEQLAETGLDARSLVDQALSLVSQTEGTSSTSIA